MKKAKGKTRKPPTADDVLAAHSAALKHVEGVVSLENHCAEARDELRKMKAQLKRARHEQHAAFAHFDKLRARFLKRSKQ